VRLVLSSIGFVVLCVFLGMGACAQIAGLEDLVAPTPDASHPSSGDGGPACSCPGCSLVVSDPSGTPQSLVTVGESVYWVDPGDDCANDGHVLTVPTTGGALAEVAGNLASPLSITTDGVSLYWYETGAGNIDKLTIGSTEVELIASGFNFDSADNGWNAPSATSTSTRILPDTSILAVVDGGVYFATTNGFDASIETEYEVWKVPNREGAVAEGVVGSLVNDNDASSGIPDADFLPESGGTQQLDPQSFAVGEDSLFWINCDSAPCTGTSCSSGTDCFSIWKIPLSGSNPVPVEVISDLEGPVNLFVSASTAYLVDYASNRFESFNAAGDSSQNPTSLGGVQVAPWALTHDQDFVYWTTLGTGGNGGDVVKYPLKGGSATTIASGLPAPAALAVDDTNVYWVDTVYDVICKAPKR